MARSGGVGLKCELLNVLGDVKAKVVDKLGKKEFPMPQFILVGKQSVGKSRLVEALAGEQFNFISGTLGSRRPTVLEFRNVADLPTSKWFVRDLNTSAWAERPVAEVMKIIGEAHEQLGHDVTKEPCYVRLESPACVDMQVVDLPGFRDFASTDAQRELQSKIYNLVTEFMSDEKNVMLCVEQAGDAANMSTLAKCKEKDPESKRTILIRNKLDKYYKDLTPDNVNKWLSGFGDLTQNMLKTTFSLTLPWWPDDQSAPPMPFPQITKQKNQEDLECLRGKGCSDTDLKNIGFENFTEYMNKKVESLFSDAIGPVLGSLRDEKQKYERRNLELDQAVSDTDPSKSEFRTQACGKTFGLALGELMKGQLGTTEGRVNLEEELRAFWEHHPTPPAGAEVDEGDGKADRDWRLPTADFSGCDDYIEYLRTAPFMENFDVKLSGGSQWKRLLIEVETFLRFSEVAADTKKKDVIQARGVSMVSLTWREVVVKLLSAEAHVPLKARVRYVAERVKYFFESQKPVILAFMVSCQDMGGQFQNAEFGPNGVAIAGNAMMKHLIFETYDRVLQENLDKFMELFQHMLTSTFANPWTFLKGGTPDELGGAEPKLREGDLPTPDERVPEEMRNRASSEKILNDWLQNIPTEFSRVDIAVDEVQRLVMRIYSLIRSQVCDQVDLFTESFFKLPMLRQLGQDMGTITLSQADLAQYKARREDIDKEKEHIQFAMKEVKECIERLEEFKDKCKMKEQYGM